MPPDCGPVVAVSAGVQHTCAIRADGRLFCFGDAEQTHSHESVGQVVAVSAGDYHTCTLGADSKAALVFDM